MPDYRAFQIGEDGHVTGRIDLVCTDDEDAKRQAQQLVGQYSIELWQHDRRIALFESVTRAIRKRAHQLWEDAGKPEGQQDYFWLEAERQVKQEQSEDRT
jgi:DUF2934 family protein